MSACTTADCRGRAERFVSCEGEGAYPYCRGCAATLIRGGEMEMGDLPTDRRTTSICWHLRGCGPLVDERDALQAEVERLRVLLGITVAEDEKEWHSSIAALRTERARRQQLEEALRRIGRVHGPWRAVVADALGCPIEDLHPDQQGGDR